MFSSALGGGRSPRMKLQSLAQSRDQIMADNDTIVSSWNSTHQDQQHQDQQQQPPGETQRRVPRRVCIDCRRRKVGCDKKQPCQHCKKSGTECVYPPDNHNSDERQMFRDTGLLERLHRLEPMLKTLASCMEQGSLLPPSITSSSVLPHNQPPGYSESTSAAPAPPTPPRSIGSTGNRPDHRLAGNEQPPTTQAPSPLGQPSPSHEADLTGGAQPNPSNTSAGGEGRQGISPKEMSGLVESPYGTSTGKLVRDDGRQRYVSGTFWEALHTEVIYDVQPVSWLLLTSFISSTISTKLLQATTETSLNVTRIHRRPHLNLPACSTL